MKYPQLVSMPSAVSDWLEEQLEARGIDSEVYTRYILSLLHAHTLDVIYPEDDLPFSQLKKIVFWLENLMFFEVDDRSYCGALQKQKENNNGHIRMEAERKMDGGRGAAFPKRIRRTGAWWRHADADAEQIKRSAAVECLMSAAEQNCEIESLVDELCEKLKEVNSESENCNETNQNSKSNKEPLKHRKISPKELAERYYAAFPPLNQKEENSYLASNINLVAGKWPSPEKSLNNIDLIAAKWTSSGSPKKAKRKPKRQPYETMKSTSRANQNRNRFGYKKAHCVRTLTREMADNTANWEFVYNNNNNYKMEDQCLDMAEERIDMDDDDFSIRWVKDWMAEVERNNQNSEEQNLEKSSTNRSSPQFVPVYPSLIWSSEKASKAQSQNGRPKPKPFDYFPGIAERGEQWSLEQHESAIRDEYQRPIEEEECAIKMEYERPFVEDIKVHIGGQRTGNMEERAIQIGGRWSTKMEQTLEPVSQDAIDFGLVRPDDNRSHVSDDLLDWNVQNETNSLLEELSRRDSTPSVFRNLRSLPAELWMDRDCVGAPIDDNDCLLDELMISLMKINHSKESSPFGEYVRPTVQNNEPMLPPSGPYSRPFGRPVKGPNMPRRVVPTPQIPPEGMWESPLVLFRPIQTPPPKSEIRKETSRRYQDGATFAIRGSLDKVDFKRTSSGSLFVETEFGESKKYLEYNPRPPSDDSVDSRTTLPRSNDEEFKLKFPVSENDKVRPRARASQTEDQEGLLTFAIARSFNEIEEAAYKVMETMDFRKEVEVSEEETSASAAKQTGKCCRCGGLKNDNCKDVLKFDDPENSAKTPNVFDLAEVVWKDSNEICKLCNGNHQWPNFIQKFDVKWDSETLKDIWEGTGMCGPPAQNTKELSSPETTTQLREETKKEADRLLSDLSDVQQASWAVKDKEAEPKTKIAPADRKRRHSYMDNDTEMWSFATRLQEDCLINLSTLPTRRSVTL